MANNSNRFNQNQYNPEELIAGLDRTAVPLNKVGNLFREKTSSLQAKIEDMIANSWGITEIDHIYILPIFDRNGNLEDVLCRAYFDTKDVSNGDIVRTGRGRVAGSSGRLNVVQYMGGAATSSGDFQLSDRFKKTFATVALSDDDRLHVNSIKDNPNVAVLDIDVNAILSVALSIDESTPYNFSILDAVRINNDDYNIMFTKYIETSSGKRGRHKGRRINYNELDKAFAKQNARYNQNNGGRNF